MVVVVLGLPGSGKSYFAERLAEKLGAKYVNSDRLRRQLFSNRTYSKHESNKVYNSMLQMMQTALGQEKNMVLDATFHNRFSREPFVEKAEGDIFFIEVIADEATIKERVKKNRPFSEADFKVYELIKKEWEPLEGSHLVLKSTNDNINGMLQQAMNYLRDDNGANR